MTKTFKDYTEVPGKMVVEFRKAQREGVRKAALTVTTDIRAELKHAIGPDLKMSGVGRNGARIRAWFDMSGSTIPVATVKIKGPWQLIERDTAPHRIVPRGRRVSKRYQTAVERGRPTKAKKYLGGSQRLYFDGHFATGVNHPGTRGKHPVERGLKRAKPKVRNIFSQEMVKGMQRAAGTK